MASPLRNIHDQSSIPTGCVRCGSTDETELGAEINIHIPGEIKQEPGVLVFPKVTACLKCGFAHLALEDAELHLIKQRLAGRARWRARASP
jgi:hypothetical protein